jgi:hypothetical protein
MTDEVRFRATLESMPRGGHAVEVDPKRAAAIGAKHRTRVRGTFAGTPYRSNLASMGGGRLILGVHKATVAASDVSIGDTVSVTMRVDAEPLPSDTVPPELEARLRRSQRARAAWDALAPSHRREYASHITEAKKPETRARRADAAIERLLER